MKFISNRDPALIKTVIAWTALALFGACVICWFTQNGVGLWEDSFEYITAAFNLAEGGGYGRITGYGNFRPLTHYPPAYSLLLAGLEISGVGLDAGVRGLNAVLFGSLIFCSGWLVWRLTRSSAWSIAAAGVVLLSETLIYAHLWALTEPLYLTLNTLSILTLGGYIVHSDRRTLLVVSAVFTMLALLTRFAEVAALFAGAAALLLLTQRPLRRRLVDTALFLGVAALPTALFILRNLAVSGNPTADPWPSWHPPLGEEWIDTLRMILAWFLPDRVLDQMGRGAVIIGSIVALALLVGMLVMVLRPRGSQTRLKEVDTRPYLWIIIFFILSYLLVYLGTILWLRRITAVDERLLTPFYWAILILLPCLFGLSWQRYQKPGRVVLLAIFGAFLVMQAWRASDMTRVYPYEPLGFNSSRWRSSETMEAIEAFPDVLIYSNDIQSIYFLTGRTAIFVPTPYNPATLVTRADFPAALERMREMMREDGARLVLFHHQTPDQAYFMELTAGLELGGLFHDGEWYYWP